MSCIATIGRGVGGRGWSCCGLGDLRRGEGRSGGGGGGGSIVAIVGWDQEDSVRMVGVCWGGGVFGLVMWIC